MIQAHLATMDPADKPRDDGMVCGLGRCALDCEIGCLIMTAGFNLLVNIKIRPSSRGLTAGSKRISTMDPADQAAGRRCGVWVGLMCVKTAKSSVVII